MINFLTKKEQEKKAWYFFQQLYKIYFSLKYNLFREFITSYRTKIPAYHIYTIFEKQNNNILKYIHFPFTRSNFCYTLYKEMYVYREINIAHFQLLLQQTLCVPSIQHSILPIPSVQIVQSRTFYPHKCLSGKNTWWRDDRDKHSMAGMHSDERATGMKFNDYKPRSTIVQRESNFNSRIGCGETCRGSSTEYPLSEINLVIEFQPGGNDLDPLTKTGNDTGSIQFFVRIDHRTYRDSPVETREFDTRRFVRLHSKPR